MPRHAHLFGQAVFGAIFVLTVFAPLRADKSKSTTQPSETKTTPNKVKIDLDKAVAIAMPAFNEDLKAEPFKTNDGKTGWAIRIPGNLPIATPACADGMIFVGGGYGSHEFYAFDADTGKLRWQIKTADDGPTGAVVEDGFCAFNTESCTIIVVNAKTGKLVWQEWLGDPLMSQPAISKGRLYMAYPGGNPRGVQNGNAAPNTQPALTPDAQLAPQQVKPPGGALQAKGNGHRLLCADLQTGKHIWEQEITADVISAPIIEGDQVFLTCFDGTSFCLNSRDGTVVWKKANAGTSAPLVADGQVIVTEKSVKGDKVEEGVRRLEVAGGKARDAALIGAGSAEYLKRGNGGNVALQPQAQLALDSSVGFGGAGPASAGLDKASSNVNIGSVAAGWSYQGARAAYSRGQILNAQGNHFNCMRGSDGTVAWQAEVIGKDATANAQMFAPPALGLENLYVCSAAGYLVSVRQKDGGLAFAYSTGQPMAFQPALAHGNVYAGTTNGVVFCLKTGEKDADGWTAWGGNAQHNKKQ